MREHRGEANESGVLVDRGRLHRRDLVLAERLANDIEPAGERRIAERAIAFPGEWRADGADQRLFRVGELRSGLWPARSRWRRSIYWSAAWPASRSQELEADRSRFGPLGPDAMPDRFLGVLRHELFQLRLGILVFQEGRMGAPENAGKFRPRIRGAHVDDADRLDPDLRRFCQEEARGLAGFDAAPELFLGREQEMLVERISRDGKFNPLAAAGDDRQHRRAGVRDPHIVLELGDVLLRRRLFGERPREHELGFEHRPGALDHAVQRGGQEPDNRVLDPPLDRRDDLAGVALVPMPVEGFGYDPELDDKIAGRSSGSASPRFSRQRRRRAASSLPMMIRASEPPTKCLRPLDACICNSLIPLVRY